MSEENVERARQIMEAVAERDLQRLLSLTDPQVEWHSFFDLGEKGTYRGHDGMRRYVSDLHDAWEIIRPEVDDTLCVGDVVVLVGRVHYRGRDSGVEADAPAGWIFKFDRGRLTLFQAFNEPERVLEATGRQKP